MLPEFESYELKIQVGKDENIFKFESGISEIIEKIEWRDEIIGNVFYPLNTEEKLKAIIHLNGGAHLLQGNELMIKYF